MSLNLPVAGGGPPPRQEGSSADFLEREPSLAQTPFSRKLTSVTGIARVELE